MSSGKEIVLFDSVDAEKWIRHVSEVYDLFSKSTEKNKVMLSFDTSIDVDSIKPFHTNGGSLWLWCCLAQPGALGP